MWRKFILRMAIIPDWVCFDDYKKQETTVHSEMSIESEGDCSSYDIDASELDDV